MNSFLKLVFKIAALLVIILVGTRVLTKKVYESNEINQTNLNSVLYQKDTIDYLFVGSSLCYSGINNPYFDSLTNKKSYNLGYATAGPILVESILKNVDLSRIKNVIWVISPSDLIDITDNIESYPYFLFNDFDDLEYYSHGYIGLKSLIRINQMRTKYFFRIPQKKNTTRRGLKGEFMAFQNNPSADSISVSELIRGNYLNIKKAKLLMNIIEANPKIRLVVYPYFRFESNYKLEVVKEFQLILSASANVGRQVIDLNASGDTLFKAEDWRNFDHVNSNGARKITSVVAIHVNNN